MATPKIRIKRGTQAPTLANLPSSGELAIDTSAKKFYIQADGSNPPLWMGAEITDSSSTWTSDSKLATRSLIDSTFLKQGNISVGGVTTTGTVIAGATKTRSLKLEDANDTLGNADSIELKAPSMSGTGYALTFPSSLSSGTMKVDNTGNITFGSDNIGVGITNSLPTGVSDYYPVFYNTTGTATNLYIDNTSAFTAINGPLKYTPSSGTLTINGDLYVNGQVAAQNISLANYNVGANPTTLLSGASKIYVANTTGIYPGDLIEFATTTVNGKTLTFSSGTTATIHSVDSSKNEITLGATGADTITVIVTGGTLNTAESNGLSINSQSLSAKITADSTAAELDKPAPIGISP
jgi:hypothetical protein